MYRKRIKSFTLFELIVVMLLSTILVGIMYYALRVAQQTFARFSESNQHVLDIRSLINAMRNDFQRAEQVHASDNQVRCYKGELTIEYEILDKSVVRKSNTAIDTFHCDVNSYKFFLANKEFNEGLIEEAEVSLKFKDQDFLFNVYRYPTFQERFNALRVNQESGN